MRLPKEAAGPHVDWLMLAGSELLVAGDGSVVLPGSTSGSDRGPAISPPPSPRSVRITMAPSPPVEDAPAAISATVVRQAGHVADLLSRTFFGATMPPSAPGSAAPRYFPGAPAGSLKPPG